MSLFGKIKSAVMGNPVTRDYEIGKQVASAGPGLMWKVHQAIKKSTRQEVSVFLFNKQTPDFEKLHKKQRDMILEILKKGPTHLVRLKHPRLLTIDHPLEESSNCLAFATESVSIGLANILGNYDNLPSPLPLSIKEYEIHPIEIQYGLYNVSEALEFLHSGVRLMHGNITPEVVVVTAGGTWKLMGFNFSCYSHYQAESTTTFEFQEWDSRRPHNTNPSLDYLAPEYILSKSCNEKSDVYSFGMLAYAVYNGGRPLCSSLNNLLSFKQNVETISRVTESGLGETPHGLRPLVRNMLAVEPSVRPDASDITKHAFFEEVGVATLRYLDTLYEKGDMERSQYFKKNLAIVITKLPKRVIHQRILPALKEEFRNRKMIPFVLPIVLLIAEDCTMQEYGDIIMPVLIPALRIQDPIQVPLILLQKMDLLLKKTPPEDVRQHVLPTIIASLETTNGQLQELCISLLPSFATTIDYSSMKHSIIPRLIALMVSAGTVSLRVKCLVAVGKMLDSLDKHIVQDHVLPLMQQIPSREPGVLMAILGIYHSVLRSKKLGMDKVVLATNVLPFLLPLSVEPTLNITQFNQFILVIREMLQMVESEQQTHLEQLSKMEEQTKSTVQFAREVSEAKAMEDTINKFEETFGTGSHDSHMIPKRGALSPTSTNGMTAKPPSPNRSDMFTGLFPSQPPSQTTPLAPSPLTSSSRPHQSTTSTSSQASQHTQNTPGTMATQPLQPIGGIGMAVSNMEIRPQSTSPNLFGRAQVSQNEFVKPVSQQPTPASVGGGYTPPGVARDGSRMSGVGGGMGMGNRSGGMGMGGGSGMSQGGSSMGMGNESGSSGWSSGVKSQLLNPLQTGSVNPLQTGSGGSGSVFRGMEVRDYSQTGMSSQHSGQSHMTGEANLIGQQSHMTGTSNPIGGQAQPSNTPLMPRQVENKALSGWSSSIDQGTTTQNTGGVNQQMGWSSGMSGTTQSSNWMSQNPSSNQFSMGGQSSGTQMMMGPLQPSVAQSSNWSMPQNQGMQSSNWASQNQSINPAPTAASVMMGGPLLSQGNPSLPAQLSQNTSDNPFADLSFLG